MKYKESESPSQIGVEITDVDISKPLNETDLNSIHSLWVKNSVAIFPGQKLSHDAYNNFAMQFGAFGKEPFLTTMKTQMHIVELRRKATEEASHFGGSWHSDWSFQSSPPSATMLHSKIVPPFGGDTLFTNSALAYDDLSADLKAKVEGLNGIHSAKLPYADDGFYALEGKERTMKIKSSKSANKQHHHPVVREHKDTKRKSLFVNPVYTVGIEGMTDMEAFTFLSEIFEHMTQDKYIYRHQWDADMLIMWDNRSVMHMAEGGYDGYERLMHRITIAGESPIKSL
jgi:taurine dioxygenase|tara:strand:- start:3053 stop:3907 length:855 start_codon:yes stop_codon:yes gene_type:complete